MKHLCHHRLAHLLAVSLLASFSARADIIILKSGEKVDGKILSENDTSLTVQYQLTPKIKDTKVINKADINALAHEEILEEASGCAVQVAACDNSLAWPDASCNDGGVQRCHARGARIGDSASGAAL